MIRYVNVYSVQQVYGGPEEGGWWYRHRSVIESHPVVEEKMVDSVIAEMEKKYGHIRKGESASSILGGNPDDLDSVEDFEENDMTGVETGVELEIEADEQPGVNTPRQHYE